MPATVRRPKIRRKELRQPDELTSLFDRATEFVDTNLQQILMACGAVVVIAAIAIGIFYLERNRAHAAAVQFSSALAALSGGNYKEAQSQFKQLAENDSNLRLGELARFYLGAAYLGAANVAGTSESATTGDLQKARDALQAFIASERDQMFLGMAQTNLAVVYERLKDWSRAADAYWQAASVAGPEQMRAELGVARMLVKEGKKDAAVSAYREFLEAHPYAPQRSEAVESLAMLGVAPQPAAPPIAPKSGALTPAKSH